MFKPGDIVEILDHWEFPTGKQFTIKNIYRCTCKPDIGCPGKIEFLEVPGRSHCFGYANPEHYLCRPANFILELPL